MICVWVSGTGFDAAGGVEGTLGPVLGPGIPVVGFSRTSASANWLFSEAILEGKRMKGRFFLNQCSTIKLKGMGVNAPTVVANCGNLILCGLAFGHVECVAE